MRSIHRAPTMAYVEATFLLNGEECCAAPPLRPGGRHPTDARRETGNSLSRATNDDLMLELAALKEREAQAQRLAERDPLTRPPTTAGACWSLLDAAIVEAAPQSQYVGCVHRSEWLHGHQGRISPASGANILTSVQCVLPDECVPAISCADTAR